MRDYTDNLKGRNNDVMKTIKSLQGTGLLIKSVSETTEMKQKNKEVDDFSASY